MKKAKINTCEIFYNEKYIKELRIVENNYIDIINQIKTIWELIEPGRLRIYILKSDLKYLLLTSSWVNKIIICTIGLPYWYLKWRKIWNTWYGVSNNKRKIPNILLKPIEVYEKLDFSIGNTIYDKNCDYVDSFLGLMCHELTHIFSYSLKLPMWLNEGLAMITVEKYRNEQNIRKGTIKLLKNFNESKEINVHEFSRVDKKIIVYNYIKGYWTVRHLEDSYPGFLKETFKKHKGEEIVKEIGKKLDLDIDSKERFWKQLDELLYDHYKYLLEE